ncbi:MAG: hypothetical protein JSS27_07825 [Planctomycetes bacterium]|nr:hypothetical protein [Planctomycetota bacterium]
MPETLGREILAFAPVQFGKAEGRRNVLRTGHGARVGNRKQSRTTRTGATSVAHVRRVTRKKIFCVPRRRACAAPRCDFTREFLPAAPHAEKVIHNRIRAARECFLDNRSSTDTIRPIFSSASSLVVHGSGCNLGLGETVTAQLC